MLLLLLLALEGERRRKWHFSNFQNWVHIIFNDCCFTTGCNRHPSGKQHAFHVTFTLRARVRTILNPHFAYFVILWFHEAIFSYNNMQARGWQGNMPGLVVLFWASNLNVLNSSLGRTKNLIFITWLILHF